MKYCTYLNKYLPESEFYSSQRGTMSKQYYRDNANKHTNRRIKRDKASVYRTKFNVPSICTYIFKQNNEVVYVGSSENTPMRLHEHYTHKRLSFCKEENRLVREAKYSWHVVWYGDNLEDARHQEKMLIQIHQPKFNKIKYKNYVG